MATARIWVNYNRPNQEHEYKWVLVFVNGHALAHADEAVAYDLAKELGLEYYDVTDYCTLPPTKSRVYTQER